MHEYFEESSEKVNEGEHGDSEDEDHRGKWKFTVSERIPLVLPEDATFIAYSKNKKDAKRACYGHVLDALMDKSSDGDHVGRRGGRPVAMKERRKLEAMLGDKLLAHVLGETMIEKMGDALTPEGLQERFDALLCNSTLSSKRPSVFPDVITSLGSQCSRANVNANATIFEAETWKAYEACGRDINVVKALFKKLMSVCARLAEDDDEQ